ncbi:alpha/beta fold hydrolase [Spirillospora sp. NPDC050679]
MTVPTTGTLRVDGATLHYEVRGEGPLLLLIPGGTGGAAAFDDIADGLADEYTVATYDPRGMSRSTLEDPEAEQRVEEHADDALRILELLSPHEPAHVFGTSSGAIVSLHLLTARPEQIERVVAHEPPLLEVLPDAAEHRALIARVREAFHSEGPMHAMQAFTTGLKENDHSTGPKPEVKLSPQAVERIERSMVNMPHFIGRIVPSFMSYTPDIPRLEALSHRLVLACGEDSRGELPYRPAASLAERFGADLVHFPGGHVGLTTHPAEFGELLRKTLRA